MSSKRNWQKNIELSNGGLKLKTLIGITPIERAFYEMSRAKKGLQEYFFTYYSMKLVLLNRFYPHVGAKLKGFPDHGPDHVIRILELYGKMLKNNIPTLFSSDSVISGAGFNFYEVYLILLATVWHDVGNLLGRKKHNEKIVEISDRLEKHFIFEADLKKYMLQIAKAHTGDDGVNVQIPIEDVAFKNEEINLRFLGALLRFADELEEGGVRIDETYYNVMKDNIAKENRIYWETACCINLIEPKPEKRSIDIKAKIDRADLFKLFPKNGKKVSLIDELIFRIDKINQERKYYMQFARKYLEFREVTFDLIVDNASPEARTFRFNNDQGYEEFWKTHSELNPKNHLKYKLQKEM